MNTELNTVEAIATEIAAKRGRKEIFEKRDLLVKSLRAIRNGNDENMPSRFLQKRLEEAGLIAFTSMKTGGRGRPQHIAHLTREGIAQLATL